MNETIIEYWENELKELGWVKCKAPKWIRFEPMYISPNIWVFNSPKPDYVIMDGFDDLYYLNYADNGQFQIYQHRTGGFGGIDVKFPVFYGKSKYPQMNDESYNGDRIRELSEIMKMTGVI